MRPTGSAAGLNAFVAYLKGYFRIISSTALLLTMLFTAVLVFLNYTVGIEDRMRHIGSWPLGLLCFFLFYAFVFFSAWAIQYRFPERPVSPTSIESVSANAPDWRSGFRSQGSLSPGGLSLTGYRRFILTLLLAPAFFALKMMHWDLSIFIPSTMRYPWDRYTLILLQLPVKLLFLFLLIAAYGKTTLGLTTKGFSPRPYLLILLCMAPIIALAATQHDFQHAYPKLRNIAFINGYTHPLWPWRLLYEISYGFDFVSVEVFFRGFLVIGLLRWAGPSAILPMTAFYCTIHFGKPLGECISSFAGGLTLGVIAWRTRSIIGGLMAHLGIAWMMEIAGWVAL
jgi:hypothetical protein